mgnify:CR=1 FL=1|tara:strand:+ start:8383 stop:8607 length:225 start_codon:yes stop_codon:yes gene_type:complete
MTVNQRVLGSSPRGGALKKPSKNLDGFFVHNTEWREACPDNHREAQEGTDRKENVRRTFLGRGQPARGNYGKPS